MNHKLIGDGGHYTMCEKCKCFPYPEGDNKRCEEECEVGLITVSDYEEGESTKK